MNNKNIFKRRQTRKESFEVEWTKFMLDIRQV